MRALLDSSVLVAALLPSESRSEAAQVILQNGTAIYVHALNEVFATLTGSALRFRIAPDAAARLIREKIEVLEAHRQARARGIRGGAIYDYLHLVAARKADVETIFTLDGSNFLSFHREGDPEIRRP